MSGIICCACSISAISVLQCALTQWRNDPNKIQEKNESQQNRDRWWILLPRRRRTCRLQLQWARGREVMGVKIHGVLLLKRTDRGDLIKADLFDASDHHYHEQFVESLLFNKLFKMGWRPYLVFSRVENWDQDVRPIGATSWNFLEDGSKSSTWFLSRSDSTPRNP